MKSFAKISLLIIQSISLANAADKDIDPNQPGTAATTGDEIFFYEEVADYDSCFRSIDK
jgi:hypothetical protein